VFVIAAAVIVMVRVFLPWVWASRAMTEGGTRWSNGFDDAPYGLILLLLEALLVVMALLGERATRMSAQVLGTALLLGLAGAALATWRFFAFRAAIARWNDLFTIKLAINVGLYLVVGGSILLLVFAWTIGRPRRPTVGETLSGWGSSNDTR
jgi:uncharacterized membrane protein YidH (DUF202 family)